MADTLLGSRIGHFRVVERIAAGGMGEVYAGFDETLQRKVAIKGIRTEYHLDEQARGRFLREARVLSQLGHPNICQIYDYIAGERSDFIVMELVDGASLKKAIRRGMSDRLRMRVAEQVAGVLVVAHEKGVIHRDLKPDNVMLTTGDEVKVLDFGLSRRLGDDETWGLSGDAPAEPPPPGAPAAREEGTLAIRSDPSSLVATTSVNVPPMSTPTLVLFLPMLERSLPGGVRCRAAMFRRRCGRARLGI